MTTTTTEQRERSGPEPWLRRLLQQAMTAPSAHNSQPWLVRARGNVVELYADHSRAAPVVDPGDRELVMSCGAFLQHLKIAARHFGRQPHVSHLPADAPDALARVTFGASESINLHAERLFRAMSARHTSRVPFTDDAVDPFAVSLLTSAALAEGAQLVVLDDEVRKAELQRWIAAAEQLQWSDVQFRDEQAAWCHRGDDSNDGLPGALVSHDDEAPGHAPVLAALVTDGDDVGDWLQGGEALARVLLTAAAEGLAATFWNACVQVSTTRGRVRELLAVKGVPQIVLGIGRPSRPLASTPRRSIEEILLR
jgi:hypothetical protein